MCMFKCFYNNSGNAENICKIQWVSVLNIDFIKVLLIIAQMVKIYDAWKQDATEISVAE